MDLGTIWEISLSAVLMISFVILVRFIFKRRMPKKMIVWLWCLVLVLLLTPTVFLVTGASVDIAKVKIGIQTNAAADVAAVSQISEAADTDTMAQMSGDEDTGIAAQMDGTKNTGDARQIGAAEDAELAQQKRSVEELLTKIAVPASFTGTIVTSLHGDYVHSTLEGYLLNTSSLSAGTTAAASVIEAKKAEAPADAVISADATIASSSFFSSAAILLTTPIISVIWPGGMLVLTVFFGGTYLWSARRYRDALPISHPNLTEWLTLPKRGRTVTVKQSDRIASPLVYGLFRPVILLPRWMDLDDREQLFFVLTHEWVHLRNFDLWKKLVMLAAILLHWFNPLVWVMLWLFNRDLELSCDERVVSLHGLTARAEYARTLIGMAEKRRLSVPLYACFSRNILEQRITAIMEYRRHSGFSAGIFIAVAVCLGGAALFGLAVPMSSTAISFTYSTPVVNTAVKTVAEAIVEDMAEELPASYRTENITAVTENQPAVTAEKDKAARAANENPAADINQPQSPKRIYKIEVVKGQIQSAELLTNQAAMDGGV